MKAKISDIFKSIQGEGLYQGAMQVFVRFFGCNLDCGFCDTKLDSYSEKTLDQLLDDINSYNRYHSVSLTGGEPLVQIDFLEKLVNSLKKQGKIIYLETNGVLCENLERIIDYIDIVSMDFKLPSSTGIGGLWPEHKKFLSIANKKEVFIKSIVSRRTDITDIYSAIAIIEQIDKNIPLVLQPESPYEDLLKEKIKSFAEAGKRQIGHIDIIPQIHKKLGIK